MFRVSIKKHAWTSQLDQNDKLSCFLNQWVLSGWCEDHRLLLLLWNKLCSNRSARTYFSFLWKVELIVALTGVITQNSMAVRHQVKHYNTSLQLSMQPWMRTRTSGICSNFLLHIKIASKIVYITYPAKQQQWKERQRKIWKTFDVRPTFLGRSSIRGIKKKYNYSNVSNNRSQLNNKQSKNC